MSGSPQGTSTGISTSSPSSSSSPPPQQHVVMDEAAASVQLQRIRENQSLIQKVLHYWFGQYTPEESQKKLWMIGTSQSVQHRQQVDAEICKEFVELLLELSSLDICNLSGDDDDVSNHNNTSTSRRWHEWCHDSTLYGYQGKLAAIIVLDQFSRHIHRHYAEQQGKKQQQQQQQQANGSACTNTQHHHQPPILDLPDQTAMDQRALETAQLLVQQHGATEDIGMMTTMSMIMPIPMYIFALMPFRHARRMETVQFVQRQIDQVLAPLHAQTHDMISRFRKATNRRLAVLQDQARRTGTGGTGVGNDNNVVVADSDSQTTTPAANDDDHSNAAISDDDILEMAPFEADMGPATQHVVQQTIRQFLADRGIHPNIPPPQQQQVEQQQQQRQQSTTPLTIIPMIVSLSGGVDSMVIASVLQHLVKTQNYPLAIIAVHIDYANRPESRAEAQYVERWCRQTLGIADFVCRRIDEVTRGVTARDAYEKISREVRYDLYRQTAQQAAKDYNCKSSSTTIGVVLGHHRGDLRENVLSNAHKGCGPLDLSGMTAVSRNNGVTLYRPLLPLEKTAIFDYAHTFGIPYFKDSTPHWSTRGKLRNKLLPLLQEIYGEGSMNNLSHLAVESDECRALLHSVCLGPFLDQVVAKPMGITFCTIRWKDQTTVFWKFVLREALHSAGLGMFTDKSVVTFMERACQANPIKEGWLQCRKDCAVHVQPNGQVMILYPSSFPWSKKDQYKDMTSGKAVQYGADGAVQVGPWTVTTELIRDESIVSDPGQVNALLEQKALQCMQDLLEGSITYYVQVPTWESKETSGGAFEPRPLVFTKFNKATRPRAWKGVEVKIQETLPLLGNDAVALNALNDPVGCGNMHTRNDGDAVIENPKYLVRVSLSIIAASKP